MSSILFQLSPIFGFFLVGLILRRSGLADRSHGEFLLRLVFFVTLPLMILVTLPRTTLTPDKALLPLLNILVDLACMGCALLLTRAMQLPRPLTGAILVNAMILNNVFMFPFILAIYGESGFADAVLFDFGNAILVATLAYAVAWRYGANNTAHDNWAMLRRILRSPLFIALGLALALSLSGRNLPAWVAQLVTPLAQMTAPLILIALGIFFALQRQHLGLVGLTLGIRMLLGLAFGLGFALLLGLGGETLIVVALCSGGPIGFMALTFSAMAKLDVDFTTSALSLSVLLGLIWIPLLILLFGS